MELNKKVLEKIAGTLNLNAEELATGLTSEEEVDFTLPEGGFYSKEDIETIKDNHGKTRYDAGKIAGSEMLLKDLSEEVGIDTTNDKSKFVDSYKSKILEEAKVEPNKKIQEMETSLKRLQDQVQEKEQAYNDLQSNLNQKETRYKVQSLIPDLPENLGLNKDEAATLLFSQMEFKEDGVYKNGELLKDNLEKPVSYEDAVKGFVTDRGWNAEPPSGRGGGAKGKGGNSSTISSQEEFEQHIKEQGLHPGSREAQAILSKAIEANPDFE